MKNQKIFSLAALFFASLPAARAQFITGDLVVDQVGTGSGALTSAGTLINLDEFTTSGSAVYSLAIPSTGPSALVDSGTATSEGALTLSANDQYLVVAGYNVPAGTTGVAGSTSASDPRGVATVDASANYSLAATTTTLYSGNNIRSGTTDGNGNFWAAGATGGQAVMAPGTPAYISTTVANSRVVQNIGGNLFYSTSSGSTRGIYEIPGAPTSGTTAAVSLINSGGSSSPYGFAFNSGMTTAYVADSDAYTTSSGFGGIEKWALVGSTWTFQYSLPVINTTGTGTSAGATGIAVNFSGANPVIYATSSDGQSLFDITDTGPNSTDTLLDTVGANEAFRGLAFAPTPVPEPSAIALLGLGFSGVYWQIRRFRKS